MPFVFQGVLSGLIVLIMMMGSLALADDPFREDRAKLAEDNPAWFSVDRGQALWASLTQRAQPCDLGLGPGVVDGAAALLPRWFRDVGAVMDLDTRLAWCRQKKGLDVALEDLAVWVASRSAQQPIAVALDSPKMQSLYQEGERLFFRRAGTHDYGCVTCHSQSGLRIRLQTLPNLLNLAELKAVVSSWPAYRLSEGRTRTLRWRIYDCLRQQHWPLPDYEAQSITALELYLVARSNGALLEAPGLKR